MNWEYIFLSYMNRAEIEEQVMMLLPIFPRESKIIKKNTSEKKTGVQRGVSGDFRGFFWEGFWWGFQRGMCRGFQRGMDDDNQRGVGGGFQYGVFRGGIQSGFSERGFKEGWAGVFRGWGFQKGGGRGGRFRPPPSLEDPTPVSPRPHNLLKLAARFASVHIVRQICQCASFANGKDEK